MIDKIRDVINKKLEKAEDNNPIKVSYENKLNYYDNFLKMIDAFNNNISEKQMKDLLNDKLRIDGKFDLAHYLQATSEINVLYYILRNYNNEFIYEPQYNGKKNPECSFKYQEKTINIEVKCPNLLDKIESDLRNTLKIQAAERIPNYKETINDIKKIVQPNLKNSDYVGVEEEKRIDNKLKDYVISASEKFPMSDDNNFNILVVSLDIVSDFDEWYSYIFGNTGVFTNSTFVPKEKYENVDAILLSNPMCGHIRYNVLNDTDVWKLEENLNFLFLNPNKEKTETGKFYFNYMLDVFGNLTKEFLIFIQELDEKSEKDNEKVVNNPLEKQIKWVDQKIVDLRIITEFVEYYKNKYSELSR